MEVGGDEEEAGGLPGDGVKAGDLRDEQVQGHWVKTQRAERAVQAGEDPVELSSVSPSINSLESPGKTNDVHDETNHDSTPSPYRKRLEGELLASLETIAHRGPDGKGVWVGSDCRVALGHVR